MAAAQSYLPNVDVPVRHGATAVVVYLLQQLLNAHGARLTLDGVYGPNTQAAVYQAFERLVTGPSFEARQIVAAGPSSFATVGELYNALMLAFDAWAPMLEPVPRPPPQPSAPPVSIPMGPAEAQQMGQQIGVLPPSSPSGPSWAWWLVGGGVVAGIGALVLSFGGRR